MKIGLQLSFTINSINGIYFTKLFDSLVKFQPHSFTNDIKTYPWNEKKHKQIIKEFDKPQTLIVDSSDSDIFIAGPSATSMQNEFHSVNIIQDANIFSPSNDIIEKLVSVDSFVSCYLYNEDYETVQFQKFHNNLNHRNIQKEIWDTVKNTPYKIGVFDKREYETKYNPGRGILISYTWIMAAWKMWYGKDFYHIVSKEKLLGFPHAVEIKELENDIVYIQLYEKIEEPYTPVSMWRQTKWLEWIDIDMLQEKFK